MTTDRLRLVARGLLCGEAIAWPDAGYRIRLTTPKRLARMETLAAFAREHGTTTPAVPYAHSSPIDLLQPGAGEAIEWFAFTARALRRVAEEAGLEAIDDEWIAVADHAGPARIGTRIPIENLRRGLRAPQSGNDNPHYFDDMPMVRAAAAAATLSDETAVREAARRDAEHTGARDGVWCAEATAVLISRLLGGEGSERAIDGALAVLPPETWSRRLAESALASVQGATGALDRAVRLSASIGDVIYSYGTVAPETLALLLGHLAQARAADELLLGALAHPRSAATLPALAGAAAAALHGERWMPAGITLRARVTGISVPALADVPLDEALALAR
ncbi:ADP-ribosylglycohydrolase family protein [Pseudolysinimonas sp.]|uniref:ADP-ribosylglycohydrolase family protein n=1 Tax=Pseudolysinimonas sp. TaxID=2680009 RepID=UPI003F81A265